MLEGAYKTKLIKKLRTMFPGCYILKNDANYLQGVPDILIIYYDRWAMLETKREKIAEKQANQDWYVDAFNSISFAAFIFPENEREVLRGLQRALQPVRQTRVSRTKSK